MDEDILVMLKVAERCNINCSYCYMYNGRDQSWRSRPKFLSDQNLELVIAELIEYSTLHPAARLTLEIHGGEPLLMGKARMKWFLQNIRRHLPVDKLFICTQTNGILLDLEWLALFEAYNATVSISCDGYADAHDAHRISARGKGTSFQVEKAIRLCLESPFRHVFNGILAVVDPNFDGAEIVSYFYDLGVRNIDFLLPDSNFQSPPKHIDNYQHHKTETFLTLAFDRWMLYQDPGFRIRMFETFIMAVFGKRTDLDAYGGDLSPIVVIESDGSYRLLDVLSICEEGVAETSLKLGSDSVNDFLEISKTAYPKASAFCRTCPAFTACGGGYLAHRFDGRSYENVSFYCPVLFNIHKYIVSYLRNVVSHELVSMLPDNQVFSSFEAQLTENYNSIVQKTPEHAL